jgi:diguanylate cyclase (GGDEF)-like protein
MGRRVRRSDPPPDGDAATGRRAGPALTTRSSFADLTEAIPELRDELADRARTAGLIVSWVAVLAMPLWTVVDRMVAPGQAGTFLLLRLICDVPMLLALWALWRLPLGRRRPEALSFFVLVVVQLQIAWMITRVPDVEYYLLGFTLAVYGSGCIMVSRPRWTTALVGVSWAALGLAGLVSPLATADLVAVTMYLGTASLIAVLAHLRRYALNNRELITRARLEREQQRTGVLLARLERLSHEDPLTGLANRRRWDAELVRAYAEARQGGARVGVVLLDIDHFKGINDRHGHPGGDETLREVARLLSSRVRPDDLVARLGGDELAVLMPGADVGRTVELAERLRSDAARLMPAGFAPGEVSLSLGVASAAGPAADPLELMSRADEQLYRAKITRNAVGAPGGNAALVAGPRGDGIAPAALTGRFRLTPAPSGWGGALRACSPLVIGR